MTALKTIRVAVPVKVARLRIWVDKGRHWSAVDRLVLWALSEAPSTANELAKTACIPSRLVVEIVLRLMRFGWVELATGQGSAMFRATAAGHDAVETFETLPPITRRVPRRLSFVLEPFNWQAYGFRDIKPYRRSELATLEQDHDVRHLVIDGGWAAMSINDLYNAANEVLPEDERIWSADQAASEIVDQYALFTVVGNAIKHLPPRCPAPLISAIRAAAHDQSGKRKTSIRRPQTRAKQAPQSGAIASPQVASNSILITGDQHREALIEILRQARSRFVMHSTFIRQSAFSALQDEFVRAAKRGVEIDIFWGADGTPASKRDNLTAAIKINHQITANRSLRGKARVHLHSTRSHAKLLFADAGGRSEGEFVAVVGSCNWLYSGYNRIESSIILRTPHAVAKIAEEMSELVFEGATSSNVATNLTTTARALRILPAEDGPARVRMVRGEDHGTLVRLARETAKKTILIGGDRLGVTAEARTIIPMMAASQNAVDRVICYSKTSGPVSEADANDLRRMAETAGVRLVEIDNKELHGKFLLWDDDNLVITSLNWSSADTRVDAPQGEIGIYVQSTGVATEFRNRLLADLPILTSGAHSANTIRLRPRLRRGPSSRRKKH